MGYKANRIWVTVQGSLRDKQSLGHKSKHQNHHGQAAVNTFGRLLSSTSLFIILEGKTSIIGYSSGPL